MTERLNSGQNSDEWKQNNFLFPKIPTKKLDYDLNVSGFFGKLRVQVSCRNVRDERGKDSKLRS